MSSPAPGHPGPRRAGLPGGAALGLIVVAAIWLQRSVLSAPFFADDFLFLDQVRHRSLIAALASPDPIGNFLRPVGRQLHFWWLARAGAESPFAFHVANLTLFALALCLLFGLVRRLAGSVAATVAVGFLALHYAADVPLEWASGSQDLLALALALAAITLHVGGRRWLAAPVFLLALLSKEVVVFTPVIAVLLDRDIGPGWRARVRRGWPLAAATLVWGVLWLGAAATRLGVGAGLTFDAGGVASSLYHAIQVAAGMEWRSGGGPAVLPTPFPWLPVALVAAAVAFATNDQRTGPGGATRAREKQPGPGRHAARDSSARDNGSWPGPVVAGLMWAALGALPVAWVAGIWSAYYFLFALCGLALALGALLARAPRAVAVLVVVLLGWGSQHGRTLDEFATAPGEWTAQSHVNRFYLRRSMRVVSRYLEALRQARPTLPSRSTVFFSGIASQVAWQTADGPVLRWAYRDSSLRSFYLNTITDARVTRGANYFFRADGDSLIEQWHGRTPWEDIAVLMTLEDREAAARVALRAGLAGGSVETQSHVHLAVLCWSAGDTAGATRALLDAGLKADRGPTPEVAAVRRSILAGGDTLSAAAALERGLRLHALDPEAHALLADILLTRPEVTSRAYVEALAARVLAPDVPQAWRRWAMVQLAARRYPQAERTLERYFELGGAAAAADAEAQRWQVALREMHPGTALTQGALRNQSRPGR